MISAKIIADSKNEFSNRLTTMMATFPRFILAELNTHRMLSKNSASSRAIPFVKMVKSVEENPFIPIAWQKDHPGMQGTEYFTSDHDIAVRELMWEDNRKYAIAGAKHLSESGVSKQLCNRLLEPFAYHTVLITATEWENFFALRCPQYIGRNLQAFRSKKDLVKDIVDNTEIFEPRSVDKLSDLEWLQLNKAQAEIHMMDLAEKMWDAYNESEPKLLKAGEWHIPFGDQIDQNKLFGALDLNNTRPAEGEVEGYRTKEKFDQYMTEGKVKIATARCARVSYTVVGEEGKPANYEADIKLHDRLMQSGHFSPFEHCAMAMSKYDALHENNHWSGNFRGFVQYRKTINGENKG